MKCVFISLVFYFLSVVNSSEILCESGFCRTYSFDVGCSPPAQHCSINNATHTGLWLPSPTPCNCCQFCLPFFHENEPCSVGGPGTGLTVGRCGDGLTCKTETNAVGQVVRHYCARMDTECHRAQDKYDTRHARGETGALEHRPLCDGKGQYAVFDCVPTQTCFCQSEEGERIFGEVLYQGTVTAQNMHCGCSRFHEKIRKSLAPSVRWPVVGPRCTSDGNYNPVQCIDRTCYCVDRITGMVRHGINSVDLDERSLTELPCYDPTLDLFQVTNQNGPPFNYTTPCHEYVKELIDLILESEEEGYNVNFFTTVPECMPDGTYARIVQTENGTKICVNERGLQINQYEAKPNTPEFYSMDCKCAQTSLLMTNSNEKPVCCKNGNFRKIQCRRGQCRCVDSDGRQIGRETNVVTELPCYTDNWLDC